MKPHILPIQITYIAVMIINFKTIELEVIKNYFKMKITEELKELIIEWAKEKKINNPEKQYLKCIEELGEVSGEIIKMNKDNLKLEIGDLIVSTIILYDIENRKIVFENLEYDFYDNLQIIEYYVDCISLRYDEVFEIINILCFINDVDFNECLNLAWNKIKGRKGKTIDGSFIKE